MVGWARWGWGRKLTDAVVAQLDEALPRGAVVDLGVSEEAVQQQHVIIYIFISALFVKTPVKLCHLSDT